MGAITEDAVLDQLRGLDRNAWQEVCDFIGYLRSTRPESAPRGSAAAVLASYGAWQMAPEEQQRIERILEEERGITEGTP